MAASSLVGGHDCDSAVLCRPGLSRRYTADNATIRAVAPPDLSSLQVTITSADRSEWWNLRLRAPRGQSLSPGPYGPVVAWTPGPSGGATPQVDFTGTGRACGGLSGRFTVRSVRWGSLGEVARFHATFEQTCSGSSAGMNGEVFIVDGGTR